MRDSGSARVETSKDDMYGSEADRADWQQLAGRLQVKEGNRVNPNTVEIAVTDRGDKTCDTLVPTLRAWLISGNRFGWLGSAPEGDAGVMKSRGCRLASLPSDSLRASPPCEGRAGGGGGPGRVHGSFCACRQRAEIVNLRSLARRNAVLSRAWVVRAQSGTGCPLRKCKGELGLLTLAIFSGNGRKWEPVVVIRWFFSVLPADGSKPRAKGNTVESTVTHSRRRVCN